MEIEKSKIYVIGHKNPDTDSVCSAIAYSFFKQKELEEEVIPVESMEGTTSVEAISQVITTEPSKEAESVEVTKELVPAESSKEVSLELSGDVVAIQQRRIVLAHSCYCFYK